MTAPGVGALTDEIDALDRFLTRLSDTETGAARRPGPSARRRAVVGTWTSLDVARHLVDLVDRVTDPERRPDRHDVVPVRSEAGVLAARRRWPDVATTRRALARAAATALPALTALQVPVAGDKLVHFGTAGQHPSHLWADGLVFEFVVHRSVDLGDERLAASLTPALDWLLSALPQTSTGLVPVLDRPVAIVLDPPGDRTATFWAVGDGVAVADGVSPSAGASLHVNGWAMLASCAGRTAWPPSGLEVTGDSGLAGRFGAGLGL